MPPLNVVFPFGLSRLLRPQQTSVRQPSLNLDKYCLLLELREHKQKNVISSSTAVRTQKNVAFISTNTIKGLK